MKSLGLTISVLAMASVLTVSLTTSAEASCKPLVEADAELVDVETTDPFVLDTLLKQAEGAGCTSDEIAQISRWVAKAMLFKAARESKTLTEAEPLLTEAVEVAGIWEVQNSLGDVARERRDFDEAALRYQLALQDVSFLADPASTYLDLPPGDDVLKKLRSKANETRLLATGFVTLPGRPACQIQSTSAWTTKVVAPIRFETDKAVMTPEGREAADELFSCLAALPSGDVKSITIIGHTDERGSHAYNQVLSERRAQAVNAFLKDSGLTLNLEVVGRGETQLFTPDSAFNYNQDERWQMSRRVEVDVVMVGEGQ